MNDEHAVKIQNLSYSYEGEADYVLRNISLSIRKGEFVLLIGPSGCGKSTLCLCLNGTIPHSLRGQVSGSVCVMGKDLLVSSISELARDVQIVFQNPDDQLTSLYVEDEVAFGPENLRLPVNEVEERVEEALSFTQLSDLRNRVVYDLSGGQKQRLAIAGALAMRPRLLIMDSPTSNLDPRGVKDVLEVMKRLRNLEEITTIVVEHNIDEMIGLADRVLVMNAAGQIVRDAPPRELLSHGAQLQNDLGIWIPEITEIYFAAQDAFLGALKSKTPWISVPEAIGGLNFLAADSRATGPRPPNTLKGAEEYLLQVNSLSYAYPDGAKVLDEISFGIKRGEFVALVGQNGSGKTTLALNMVGILRPSSGSIALGGTDTRRMSMYEICRRISYVFQYPDHQFVEDSVIKEMMLAMGTSSVSQAESELRKLGLDAFKQRYPYNLSLGEKRRLSVRLMTIAQPEIIVLDEPTYGQDRRRCYGLMDEMRSLNKAGTTIVFITHHMRLVAEYANHVIAVRDGKLAYDGNTYSFFSNHEVLKGLALDWTPAMKVAAGLFGEPQLLSVEEFKNWMRSDTQSGKGGEMPHV
jgi:energy-coupling factor transport system ATP-binding protein